MDLHFGATMPFPEDEMTFQARWMEDLGYECLAIGEHFMRGNPPIPSHTAIPLLAVAAGATEKIGLLSSILLAPFYHPTILAKMTTTLDVASRGRLILGVGVGGEFPVEFEAAELKVKQRGSRTNECLEILTRLWTEEHVTHQGRHFQLNDVTLKPPPTQKPHPPIWVAGRRDAAMRRTARYGNGWLPYFYDPNRYKDSVDKIIQFAAQDGRELDHTFQWGLFPYTSIYPTVEEAAEKAAVTLGGNYLYRGDFMDVVKRYCVLGPVERCIDRLEEYIRAGARYIVFSVTCPMEDRTRQMETIAKEIIPGLRERVS